MPTTRGNGHKQKKERPKAKKKEKPPSVKQMTATFFFWV
jgi:hypothetical protein